MYTELKVMQSNAGYYIGRGYIDHECGGMEMPGSRESGYYRTKEEAEAALKEMTFEVRDCTENNAAYDKGSLPDIRPSTKNKEECAVCGSAKNLVYVKEINDFACSSNEACQENENWNAAPCCGKPWVYHNGCCEG